MWKTIKYIIIFFALQIVCALALSAFFFNELFNGDKMSLIFLASGLSSALFCLFIYLVRKDVGLSRDSFRIHPWQIVLLGVGAVVFFFLPEIKLTEILDLPDNLEGLELGSFWGLLAGGIIQPVAEELLFRGAVLGALLSWRPLQGKPWWAVLLSAVLFSVIHMNPGQMPTAFLIGLLLGWLTYRTGSLLPGIVMHVFNNSVVFICALFMTEEEGEETLADLFGSPVLEYLAIGVSLVLLILVIRALVRLVNRHYPVRPAAPAPAEGDA